MDPMQKKLHTSTLVMESKTLASFFMLLMMFCHASSDFSQDKKECQGQLLNLSPCLTYVSGGAKAPSPTCCTELKKDVDKSKLCLCILVKDRNEPDLGFKLNATLALNLIPTCRIQSNATICTKLLHLAPNSPEAQVFKQFGDGSSVGASTSSAGELSPSSSVKARLGGLRPAAIKGVLIWVLLSFSGGTV